MSSELELRFNQIDIDAKKEIANITATHLQPWSNLNDFRLEDILEYPGNYATLESNYTVLDGTFKEFPDNTSNRVWGLFSNILSNQNGVFATPISLVFTFNSPRKTDGISFRFYPFTNDNASTAEIIWYANTNATGLIRRDTYTLMSNGPIFEIKEFVEGYRRVDIRFVSTNNPIRFLKLYAIDFGIIRFIFDHEIDNCNVYEEIDNTVESISLNTLSVTIRTLTPLYSPITSERYTDIMMERQPIYLYRNQLFHRLYFLDAWRDVTGDSIVFEISASDAISILDMHIFKGGIYNNVLATSLLDEIFNICFPTRVVRYEIDIDIRFTRISGYLPRGSCGLAFQQIMFALNATANTAKTVNVLIRSNESLRPAKTYVSLRKQYMDNYEIKLNPPIYGVSVISYSYTQSIEERQIIRNEIFGPGTYEIFFDEPLHSLQFTPSNTQIVERHVNHVIFRVSQQTEISLVGRTYVVLEIEHNILGEYRVGVNNVTKRYEGYTLVDRIKGGVIARRLFIYSQMRINLEASIALDSIEVGDRILMQTNHLDVIGIVNSIDTLKRTNKGIISLLGNVTLEKDIALRYTGMINSGMDMGVIYAR